uniref:Lipid droplet associated hydrolase n=1 Tax=Astyanax mexicanus TaxID=7994 RepID=A0A8B9RDZ3_ASTMX
MGLQFLLSNSLGSNSAPNCQTTLNLPQKVLKSVLLFPTIERMAVTPQGKVMTPLLCNLRYTAYLPVFLLSLLPERLKTSLVHLVLKNVKHLDTLIVPPTASLINVDCVGKTTTDESLKFHVMKDLVFYYGATDHWCPVQYYYDLRRDFPDGDIRLCERGHRHAFVLDAGQEMGEMTTEWIREELRGLYCACWWQNQAIMTKSQKTDGSVHLRASVRSS